VTSGISTAKQGAGERNVVISSADIAAQALDLGLVDEVHVSLAPVLLGKGIPIRAHDAPPQRPTPSRRLTITSASVRRSRSVTYTLRLHCRTYATGRAGADTTDFRPSSILGNPRIGFTHARGPDGTLATVRVIFDTHGRTGAPCQHSSMCV
jgi:hypothetical protein